jgi:hypothetical protein
MIFVKIAILLWVLFFVIGKFVASGISPAEEIRHALGIPYKVTFGRVVVAIVFIALIDSFVALIWFLFFR